MAEPAWHSEGFHDVKLTAVFVKVPEGYVGLVEELPGANTQGKTLQEARDNIREAIEMTFEANGILAQESRKKDL